MVSYEPNRTRFLYHATWSSWDSINVPCYTSHLDPNGLYMDSAGRFCSMWAPSESDVPALWHSMALVVSPVNIIVHTHSLLCNTIAFSTPHVANVLILVYNGHPWVPSGAGHIAHAIKWAPSGAVVSCTFACSCPWRTVCSCSRLRWHPAGC